MRNTHSAYDARNVVRTMLPKVSIIVPCYNEEATIRQLLDSILTQTYPREQMEVVIADGLSTDSSRKVIETFQQEHSGLSVKVVENTLHTIPSGLNLAIKSARGEIIVRLDAHSAPIPEYVARCVDVLESGKGANVGGVWEIKPGARTWIAESISAAAAHPMGVGDAMYRLNAKAGAVDTVPFGSFHRSLIEKIGGFDEALLTNEDYEFNTRVRQSGGVVWLEPSIRSVYFARSTYGALARQYWRYGFWKWRMLARYPSTLRWRQALPPLFVAVLIGLGVLSAWLVLARIFIAVQITLYLVALIFAGFTLAVKKQKFTLIFGLPIAIVTMHMSWGSGFLWSMVTNWFMKQNG
jgi:succinoglycan biosynthesis protein ExoA